MAGVSPSEEEETTENARRSPRVSEKQSRGVEKVPYYKLFSFADAADHALMVTGVITSVGSGLALPLMTFLYGELANSFGHNVGTQALVDEVSKVSLKFLYLALGAGVAAFSRKYRNHHLKLNTTQLAILYDVVVGRGVLLDDHRRKAGRPD